MTKRTCCAVLVAAASALGSLTACSDKTSVGTGVNTKFNEKVGQRLGEATATTVAPPTTAPSQAAGGKATATTTASAGKQATATTQAIRFQEVVLDASGFDTNPIRVYVGTPIRFTNRDAKTRSILGDAGEFDSGPIAPGANFVFTPRTAGGIDVASDVPFHTTHIDVISR